MNMLIIDVYYIEDPMVEILVI